MKKVLAKGLALAFVGSLFVAGNAMATLIAFDVADDVLNEYLGDDLASSVSVTDSSTLWGTSIAVSLVSDLDEQFFTLETGETATFDFFDITISDFGFGYAEIVATLAFDAPEIEATGDSTGLWSSFYIPVIGVVTAGGLTWDDFALPDEFIFAGQLLSVDFSDLLGLTLDSPITVTASVTNLGAAPVPEPATMLLFGSGLAGLAGYGRRKARKK